MADTTVEEPAKGDEPQTDTPANGGLEHKPTKPLPTLRAKAEKQLEFLRAFAAASGRDRAPVINTKVADIANVSVSTISSCNLFFSDVKLIEQAANGRGYVPSAAVVEFHRAFEWNPVTAAQKLAPLFQDMWFWEALSARLAFRALSQDDAVDVLAETSSAGPMFKPQLAVIIDLLEAVGLVARENGMIRRQARPDQPVVDKSKESTGGVVTSQLNPSGSASVTTVTNSMSISMNVTVPMDAISKWDNVEKVQSFFKEWANLVNAKAAIEKMMSESEPAANV